ncbi:hypothetical protein HMPREF0262_03122 [Clostridium sp. ATCC 29733]|nr:hypothetical protein HMPREF0262_03122 [Clostridium sp. ATCC 29733]
MAPFRPLLSDDGPPRRSFPEGPSVWREQPTLSVPFQRPILCGRPSSPPAHRKTDETAKKVAFADSGQGPLMQKKRSAMLYTCAVLPFLPPSQRERRTGKIAASRRFCGRVGAVATLRSNLPPSAAPWQPSAGKKRLSPLLP